MFDHIKFGVSDYAASKAFFLKALEPLGVAVIQEGPPTYGVELSPKGKASLCLYQTEEKPAHLHLAFRAENRQQVEAFYRAAIEAGGKDNGAPGLCPELPRELLRSFRHWSGRAQHRSGLPRTQGLTLPSRGRPQAGFAHLRPPLMSNVFVRHIIFSEIFRAGVWD
jgi:catechol 2,3-dioxygenase-like lactoylglutathione lyase family enzyme